MEDLIYDKDGEIVTPFDIVDLAYAILERRGVSDAGWGSYYQGPVCLVHSIRMAVREVDPSDAPLFASQVEPPLRTAGVLYQKVLACVVASARRLKLVQSDQAVLTNQRILMNQHDRTYGKYAKRILEGVDPDCGLNH